MGKKRSTHKGSSWLTCPCCPSAGLRQVGCFTRRSSHFDSLSPPSDACSPSFSCAPQRPGCALSR
jgi:hypothetical protein